MMNPYPLYLPRIPASLAVSVVWADLPQLLTAPACLSPPACPSATSGALGKPIQPRGSSGRHQAQLGGIRQEICGLFPTAHQHKLIASCIPVSLETRSQEVQPRKRKSFNYPGLLLAQQQLLLIFACTDFSLQ